MQHIRNLIEKWREASDLRPSKRDYTIKLPVRAAARIEALTAMFPDLPPEAILQDLVSAALDELEASLPYEQGDRKIGEDEFGDTLYEDVGPSRRFHELTRINTQTLREELAAD